jgi:hypothetical protein
VDSSEMSNIGRGAAALSISESRIVGQFHFRRETLAHRR